MNLATEAYITQRERWPKQGRHILAHYDAETVVVYQAFKPSIARFATGNQRFGGDFSMTRMSWIKPNFLWMMYRSGWATKPDQEHVLAVTLPRAAFEALLAGAVPSTHAPHLYDTHEAWQKAVGASSVRLQWDPDHAPSGGPVERRAVQLGLRGDALRRYAREDVLRIEDVTPFVHEQAAAVRASEYDRLVTPRESVYPLTESLRERLGASAVEEPK